MKRLSKKPNKRDQEIADYMFTYVKDLLVYQPTIDFMKKLMKEQNITLEDMENDEYDMESIIRGTLKQCLDLYDAVHDNYFDDGPGKTTWNTDARNRDSESSSTVSYILDNFSQYGKNYNDLFTDSLKKALGGK